MWWSVVGVVACGRCGGVWKMRWRVVGVVGCGRCGGVW